MTYPYDRYQQPYPTEPGLYLARVKIGKHKATVRKLEVVDRGWLETKLEEGYITWGISEPYPKGYITGPAPHYFGQEVYRTPGPKIEWLNKV
jgi:hypothetical protein